MIVWDRDESFRVLQRMQGTPALACVRFSPDGKFLYFVSERDGLGRCLWAQPLDPVSKQPDGELLALLHSHEMRHGIMRTDAGQQNIDVTADAVYFSMQELSSNIWMATIEQ